MVKYVERGNVTSSPCAMQGRHYRKACYWSGDIENVEKANAILSRNGQSMKYDSTGNQDLSNAEN